MQSPMTLSRDFPGGVGIALPRDSPADATKSRLPGTRESRRCE